MQGRIAYKNFHDWIIPRRVVLGLFLLGLSLIFLGIVFIVIGSSRNPSILQAWGSVLLGVGLCLHLICFLLCMHAYFVLYVQDEETQTWDELKLAGTAEKELVIPTYATIERGSPAFNSTVDGSLPPRGSRSATSTIKKVVIASPYDDGGKERMITAQSQLAKKSPSPDPQFTLYEQPQLIVSSYDRQPHPSRYDKHSQSVDRRHQSTAQDGKFPLLESTDDDYDLAESTSNMGSLPRRPWQKALDVPPEPQLLQYPSAKRPMTFEQTSSSKMSIYDNVHIAYADAN